MLKTLLPFAALTMLSISGANAAESSMRPGLWEVTTTSDLLKLVPQIPADQMAKLSSLAKQYGLEMPHVQDGAAVSKTCITQAMADRNDFPDLYQQQSGCSSKNATRTGNNYRMDFACTNAKLSGTGTAQSVFTSRESFAGRTSFSGVVQGAQINEQADINGRWVGATCGAVKAPR